MKRLKLLSNKELLTLLILAKLPGKYITSDTRRSEASPNFSKGEKCRRLPDLSFLSGYPSAETHTNRRTAKFLDKFPNSVRIFVAHFRHERSCS